MKDPEVHTPQPIDPGGTWFTDDTGDPPARSGLIRYAAVAAVVVGVLFVGNQLRGGGDAAPAPAVPTATVTVVAGPVTLSPEAVAPSPAPSATSAAPTGAGSGSVQATSPPMPTAIPVAPTVWASPAIPGNPVVSP